MASASSSGQGQAVDLWEHVGMTPVAHTPSPLERLLELRNSRTYCQTTIGLPPVIQSDMHIRVAGEAAFVGDNLYNTTGANQSRSKKTSPGATAVYEVRIQNDALIPGVVTVVGPRSANGWTVRYFDTADNSEVTATVVGDNGILFLRIPLLLLGGQTKTWRVEVTAGATVAPGASFEVAMRTSTIDNPLQIDLGADVVKATTLINKAPVAQNDSYAAKEGTALSVTTGGVLSNDSDPEGDTLTATVGTNVSHGTLALASNGNFTYTSAPGWSGTDSFTYTASDDYGGSAQATVTLTVRPLSSTPVAKDDYYSTPEDTLLSRAVPGVLRNDSDADGDALTAVLVENIRRVTGETTSVPSTGLTLNTNGSFSFVPPANESGLYFFRYKASDGTRQSELATVRISVIEANDAPVAVDDPQAPATYTTPEDTPLTIAAGGVLANDSDPDGDSLSASLVQDAAHGRASLNSNGTFTYVPEANYAGPDWFRYEASDGRGGKAQAVASLIVTPVADSLQAMPDEAATEYNTGVAIDVLANDRNPDGGALSVASVTAPSHGTAVVNSANSTVIYTPSGYSGADTFTYTARTASGATSSARVRVTVAAPPLLSVNDTATDEGDLSTSHPVTLTVSLSRPATSAVTFAWRTRDGVGTSGARGDVDFRDYVPASGTGTIAAGQTQTTLTVTVVGDALDEPNELFAVELSNVQGVEVDNGTGRVLIRDDDAAPVEGACGPVDVAFVIDDTGSMGQALNAINGELTNILDDISTTASGDYRLSLVTFKDDVTVREAFAPQNRASIAPKIQALYADGGNNGPEASDEALNTVINALPAAGRSQTGNFAAFRPGALKIVILVTDALPGSFDDNFVQGTHDRRMYDLAAQAARKGIKIASVHINPGPGSYPGSSPGGNTVSVAQVLKRTALYTGGIYVAAQGGTGAEDALRKIIRECGGSGKPVPEDDPAPTITINLENGDALPSAFAPLTGTASDEGVAGLEAVQLVLRRESDNAYWSGSDWSLYRTMLTATLDGNNWSYGNQALADKLQLNDRIEVTATATDTVGKEASVSRNVRILKSLCGDTEAPVISYAFDNGDVLLSALSPVSGTVQDPGCAGLDSATLRIKRRSDGYLWSGDSWVPEYYASYYLPLSPTRQGNTWIYSNDEFSGSLKLGDELELTFTATDKAANTTTLGRQVRVVKSNCGDTAPPAPTFSFDNGTVSRSQLAPVSGQAPDVGCAGTDNVSLIIRRPAESTYWSEYGWTYSRTRLSVSYNATSNAWSYSSQGFYDSLRLGDELELVVVAQDKSANTGSATRRVKVVFSDPGCADTQSPTLTIEPPATLFSPLGGVAQDAGCAGLYSLDLQISRLFGSMTYWWNGYTWVGSATSLKLTTANGRWSCSRGTLNNLLNGGFAMTLTALDKAGNRTALAQQINPAYSQPSLNPAQTKSFYSFHDLGGRSTGGREVLEGGEIEGRAAKAGGGIVVNPGPGGPTGSRYLELRDPQGNTLAQSSQDGPATGNGWTVTQSAQDGYISYSVTAPSNAPVASNYRILSLFPATEGQTSYSIQGGALFDVVAPDATPTAQPTATPTLVPTATPAPTATPSPARPDLVAEDPSRGWFGDNQYSNAGTDQQLSVPGTGATPVSFYVYLQNDSLSSDQVILTGPASDTTGRWHVEYFDGSGEFGNSITDAVTGGGYLTRPLGPNSYEYVQVKVTPPSDVVLPARFTFPLGLYSYRDTQVRDVMQVVVDLSTAPTPTPRPTSTPTATPTMTPTRTPGPTPTTGPTGGPTSTPRPTSTPLPTPAPAKVDALGRATSATQWEGDNVYAPEFGANTQVVPGSGLANTPITYVWRLQNESASADRLVFFGANTDDLNGKWIARYSDKDGNDITAKVTQSGWQSPSVDAGGYYDVGVSVTSRPGLNPGSAFGLFVQGLSSRDNSKRDTLKFLSTVNPPVDPTATPIPTNTPVPTNTPIATNTPAPTPGGTPLPTPTNVPEPTATAPLPQLAAPEILPAQEAQSGVVKVTIGMPAGSGAPADTAIFYTNDGSEPTPQKTRYTHPFYLVQDTVVRARAYATGYDASPLARKNYTLSTNAGGRSGVDLITPGDGSEVTERTQVKGTVPGSSNGQGLVGWQLGARLVDGDAAWQILASGNTAQNNQVLVGSDGKEALFDPTLLLNGLYELRLEGFYADGGKAVDFHNVVVKGGMKIGHFTMSFNDITLPVAGMPITLTRSYDSRDQRKGDFGVGWSLSLSDVRFQKNGPVGGSEDAPVWRTSATYAGMSFASIKPRVVTFTLPDGQTMNFQASIGFEPQNSSVIKAHVEWTAGRGARGAKLRSMDGGTVYTSGGSGPAVLYSSGGEGDEDDPFFGAVYDPHVWELSLPDGRVLHFTEQGDMTNKGKAQLDWVEDEAGNVLRFGKDGIVSEAVVGDGPDGPQTKVVRRITFVRNMETGFITEAKDMNGGVMRYVQDAGGNLTTVYDRENNPTRFDYLNRFYPHYVTDIRDARGVRVSRNFYEDGRLIKTVDADGKEMLFDHNLAASQETVTNRLGFKTVMLYDLYGNVIETRRELRGGTNSKWLIMQSAYGDARNPDLPTSMMQSVTQADGSVRQMTTTMVYNAYGDVTSTTDPNGNTTTTTYNDRANVEMVKDARGRTTTRNIYYGKAEFWSPSEGVAHKQPEGALKATVDEAGQTTLYAYYPNGALGQVTGPDGRVTRYAVDLQTGNVLGMISDYGTAKANSLGFTYDANGNKTGESTWFTDSLTGGRVMMATHTDFDHEDRPVLVTLSDGTKNYTHYNSTGKVDYSIMGMNSTYRGELLARTVQNIYDMQGRRTLTQSMDGSQTRTFYDDEGQATHSLDCTGRGIETVYDSLGRATQTFMLRPDGTPDGTRVLGDDGQPMYTLIEYDELGRTIASRDMRGAWSYTRYGTQTENVVVNGASRTVMVDTTETENALHQVSRSIADELGRGWRTFDAKNHMTTSVYDETGRVAATVLHDGTQRRTRFDEVGRPTATWTLAPDGTTTMGWKKMRYTAKGELWQVIQSSQGVPTDDGSGDHDMVTQFAYDEAGHKIAQTDANGHTTGFGYDERGRMNRRVLPDGKTESMTYDDLGQLRTKTDFRGYTTRYEYDVRGRLTVKAPDSRLSEPSVTYTYTGENLKVAKRGDLTTTYALNAARGWLDSVSSPTGTIQYTYDVVGNRTGVSASGGITTYTYDALNRMKTVSDKPTGSSVSKLLATYGYDAVGNLQSTVTSNGASTPLVTTRYGYDTLNRLDAMSHRRGLAEDGSLVSGFDYAVRADGKRTGVEETVVNGDLVNGAPRVSNRTIRYSYDDAGRLIGENGKDGAGVAYKLGWVLDAVGNRMGESRLRAQNAASTDWSGGTLTRTVSNYSASGTDWLTLTTTSKGTSTASGSGFADSTSDSQTSYGYDPNGSQTRVTKDDDSDGYEWDFEGDLARVEKGVTNATRFTTDAAGNRMQMLTRNGATTSTTNYLVDENTEFAQVLEERDGNGILQARYVYGQGFGPLWIQRAQKNTAGVDEVRTRFLFTDGHGSTRQLMDESGTITDSYFYDVWGSTLAGGSGNTINPYRYNGQQSDSVTGSYFLRARYYQPGNARFLSHDPVLGKDDTPFTLHRYAYGENDPVNLCDPSGRWSLTATLATIAIATIAVYQIVVPGTIANVTIARVQAQEMTTTQLDTCIDLLAVIKAQADQRASNPQTGQDFRADMQTVSQRLSALFEACDYAAGDVGSLRTLHVNIIGDRARVGGLEDHHTQGTSIGQIYVAENARRRGDLTTAIVIYSEFQHTKDGGDQQDNIQTQTELDCLKYLARQAYPNQWNEFRDVSHGGQQDAVTRWTPYLQ